MATIAHDSRVWKYSPNDSWIRSGVTRFFAEFTHASNDRIRVRGVQHSSGDLQFDRVGAMSKLLDHDEFLARCDRDHIDPVHGIDDVKIVRLACPRIDPNVGTN